MLRRLIAYFRTASFWGGVLLFLGLAWAVAWLGIGQPNLVCLLSEGLLEQIYGSQPEASVAVHRRVRQMFSGWRHDDGWWVGRSGAKEDIPEILNTRRNKDFDTCDSGHRGAAMNLITNHQIDGCSRDDWKKWWEEHYHQTQAEWMMAGFKAKGIEFTLPPDHATVIRLLKLIGRDAKEQETRFNADAPALSLPSHIVTNLKRVLHCHGFSGTEITTEDIAADANGDLRLGISTVLKDHVLLRIMHDPFKEPQRPISQVQLSGVLNPTTPWIQWAGSFVLFQSGFFLWLRARFRRAFATAFTALDNAQGSDQTSTPVSP